MKRLTLLAVPVLVLGIFLTGTPAAGQLTENNWSIGITFSTSKTADLLPLTLGASSSTAIEIMKPPPMPGKAITSNDDDAIVNAYVKLNSKKVAESIVAPIADSVGQVWPVEVVAEEANADVSASINLSSVFTGYKVAIVDPETGTSIPITQTNTPVVVFKTGAAGSVKTLYVIASSSNSYAVGSAGNLSGKIGISGVEDASNIKIYFGTSLQGSTLDSTGRFTFPAGAGTYSIRVSGDKMISSVGTVTVNADGTAAVALPDPSPGDLDGNGEIDLTDFLMLKRCFGKTVAEGNCTQTDLDAANVSRDAAKEVDLSDFLVLKRNFGKTEPQ
jgi:hypothetical protein